MSQSVSAVDTPLTGGFQAVIGLEVHAQVLTRSKMFCSCSATYSGAAPNTHVCTVCGGMPGSLPVINARAVESTVLTALALQCTIPESSKFDRKNYPYPDLPKGYQVTQYDRPIGEHGSLAFEVDGELHHCGITRVHLEEDTGKSIHVVRDGREVSLVDYNRSGIPLMEIVSEPEIRTPLAAREYFVSLRQMLMYLGVSDGNLQDGSLRADVNVSLSDADGSWGTKVEIKNLNSFRAVERALEYEIERQRGVLQRGESLRQETRGWLEDKEITVAQRTKEYAHDYRYFPEPDLPPLRLTKDYVDALRAHLPEMARARRERLISTHGLSRTVSALLTDDKGFADFFEATVEVLPSISAAKIANWLTGEVLRLMKEHNASLAKSALTPSLVAQLVQMVETGMVSSTAGKTILEQVFTSGEEPRKVAGELDLLQMRDEAELIRMVEKVVLENQKLVDIYHRGKVNALQALVGQVMKASRGKANPQRASELILEFLSRGAPSE